MKRNQLLSHHILHEDNDDVHASFDDNVVAASFGPRSSFLGVSHRQNIMIVVAASMIWALCALLSLSQFWLLYNSLFSPYYSLVCFFCIITKSNFFSLLAKPGDKPKMRRSASECIPNKHEEDGLTAVLMMRRGGKGGKREIKRDEMVQREIKARTILKMVMMIMKILWRVRSEVRRGVRRRGRTEWILNDGTSRDDCEKSNETSNGEN